MTEAVFYTDSTPPVDYTGSLNTAISGLTTGIDYKLYEDTATWDAWYDWAVTNAFDDVGFKTYSSRALKIVGHWPTMQVNSADVDGGAADNTTRSFMCITASSKGGVCMEALVGASENTVNTYYLAKDDIGTKLQTAMENFAWDSGTFDQKTTDFDFVGTTISSPGLTLVQETPDTP